jgi:hypothetical protein
MPSSGRLRRLSEELVESGLTVDDGEELDLLVAEIEHALRPPVHERRVPSTGTIVHPTTDPDTWSASTGLAFVRGRVDRDRLAELRRFADGLSSWMMRDRDHDEWVVFDRPAGSERDLVVLSDALGASVVQRHPSGRVRVVGSFGVLRTHGLEWQHEPRVAQWIDAVIDGHAAADDDLVRAFLEFSVHDLGAQGIGALLIYRPADGGAPPVEERLPTPPALNIRTPFHLAPLRHALGQVDGAAVFDGRGTLVQLGVRVVPSRDAEANVDALGGTRHTSARRYSYDDPDAIVVAVSEDGPVTVLRNGAIVGHSA